MKILEKKSTHEDYKFIYGFTKYDDGHTIPWVRMKSSYKPCYSYHWNGDEWVMVNASKA